MDREDMHMDLHEFWQATLAQDAAQMTLGDAAGDEIAEQLRGIDLNTITPLEAMRLLFELQQKARG